MHEELSPMKPHHYSILAALMAHSNMGLQADDPKNTARTLLRDQRDWVKRMTVESAVCSLSGAWIESDEIEETFYAEARAWEEQLKNLGIVATFKTWPWLAEVISPRELEPDYDAMLNKEEARLCS